MAHSNIPRVRVIKRYNPGAKWDDGWLLPALNWLKRVHARFTPAWSAMLRRWGGVAGMVGGLLWAALSFLFLLDSHEIYFLLGYPTFLDNLIYFVYAQGLYLVLILPLTLFTVALLSLYQYEPIRASRLGRVGLVLSLLGLGLIILVPPIVYWLDYAWLNRGIANVFRGGWTDTPLSEWYFSIGFDLLPIGLILLGISSLRARAFPTVVMLGLTVCSFGLLLPTIVVLALFLGVIAYQLPYEFTYEVQSLMFGYGLSHLIDYPFGISWIGLGYALHCKARYGQSTTQA